jgi:cell division ATPase FtsA
MFPPPTATLCVALLGVVGVVVPVVVVVVVPPRPSVEAIAVCVNNKAGAQIDAIMIIIIAAMVVTDPA